MPVSWDAQKGRWRFFFRRIVVDSAGQRRRATATKLLPAGWDQVQAQAYDAEHTPKLYALASGTRKPPALIERAVALYVTEKCPHLRNGRKAAQELANLLPYYRGRTFDDLQSAIADYRRDHPDLSEATVRNRFAYLRAACRYAHRFHKVGEHRPEVYLPTVHNERQVYLRDGEQQALWDAFDDDEARALFTLAYYVGARWRAEVLPRQPADVVREERDVWLDCGLTKNGKRKMKFVPLAARWALKYVPFQYGERHYYEAFWRARKAANMEHVRPHDQRHSLASKIISGGGTLKDVQAALGQESMQAANRYAHLYDDRVKQVLQKAGKRKR